MYKNAIYFSRQTQNLQKRNKTMKKYSCKIFDKICKKWRRRKNNYKFSQQKNCPKIFAQILISRLFSLNFSKCCRQFRQTPHYPIVTDVLRPPWPVSKGFSSSSDVYLNAQSCLQNSLSRTVWPVKSCQMSIKVAHKWFH